MFERALNEIEQWSRNLAGQIDSQLRERRRGLRRRLASIERAEAAASGLDERIQEIEEALYGVKKELKTFLQQMDHLLEDTTPQQEPPVLLAL